MDQESGKSKSQVKLLILAGDPGDLDFLKDSLDTELYMVTAATDRIQALKHLSACKDLDAVVLDISVNPEEMAMFLKSLSEDFSHLPCVLLSCFSENEIDAQNINLTSSYILFKHRVTPDMLRSSISQVITHQNIFAQLEKSRKELKDSEQRFRTMIEKNVDVMVIFGKDSLIKYINPTGKTLFGERGERLLPYISGFPVISGQKMMFSITDDDHEKRYWEVRVVIINWVGEASFLATIRDITDWKNAEKEFRKTFVQLERSNKDLETFAYVASHDLQEPLRTVSGFMSLLERKYSSDLNEQARDYIGKSIKATSRMRDMILSLLDYSRLSTQTQAFKLNDMNELLDTALENLSESIEQTGAVITRDRLPELWTERNQIIRLLQNLIGNAIKFSDRENPKIHVGIGDSGDKTYNFYVSDNGIGIDPQFISRIFVIFQRLDKKKYPGTGIGLAMCKKIVEYHGGRIWVDSKPGEGSTFHFTLSTKPRGGGQ